ncbi:DUF1684 domain-containing protein [Dyadobacter sp. CY312]|uniref:DUF1684 domain-containing protein n=1 Tax=Dyadobacter sp. CY312 TaxID=2907303 RepID=UPI001F2F5343|nr:DUF1684 domain-containing protein [Dyadobacter sp. CY312]MCE7041559.1 DUF1684 domain-containing protein [Dyadobacter sp. CY312]
MFKNKVIRWSTIAMVIAILAYFVIENFGGSSTDAEDIAVTRPQEYIEKINKERAAKDELFRTGKDSPIADKESFHGLHYFKVNPEYRVKATISPYMKDDKEMIVTYTDSTSEKYERYGYANFKINGQDQKLLLLRNESVISILFRDETSGKETYGGGRYLDYPVSEIKNNTITLDFNNAYSPYCAYQPDYACPVPPAENTLHIPIWAGEQTEEGVH